MSNRNLEDWVKESVEGVKTTPSPQVWESLSSNLAAQAGAGAASASSAASSASGLGIGGWIAASVAVVAVTASIWYASSTTESVAENRETPVEIENNQSNTEAAVVDLESVESESKEPKTQELAPQITTIESQTQETEKRVTIEPEVDELEPIALQTSPIETQPTPQPIEDQNTTDAATDFSETPLVTESHSNDVNVDRSADDITVPETSGDLVDNTPVEEDKTEAKLTMPNIFTPGTTNFFNDQFEPLPNETFNIESYRISVYDSSGKLVWTASEDNQPWDGVMRNGEPAPNGWYIYSVIYHTLENEEGRTDGRVMIQR